MTENVDSSTKCDEQFLKVLNIHSPLKRKLLRANYAPYISKTLRKFIMRRSYLEKILDLGPLLFNIYLNDLFFLSEFTDLCNFADDTTFYACDMDLNSLIKRLEHDSFLAIEWLKIMT